MININHLPPFPFTGPVNVRSHPAPETPGNSIGLEAIIRKALMGKYDDQNDERSSSNAAIPMGSSVSAGTPLGDGRAEDCFIPGATSSDSSTVDLVYFFSFPSQAIQLRN